MESHEHPFYYVHSFGLVCPFDDNVQFEDDYDPEKYKICRECLQKQEHIRENMRLQKQMSFKFCFKCNNSKCICICWNCQGGENNLIMCIRCSEGFKCIHCGTYFKNDVNGPGCPNENCKVNIKNKFL